MLRIYFAKYHKFYAFVFGINGVDGTLHVLQNFKLMESGKALL